MAYKVGDIVGHDHIMVSHITDVIPVKYDGHKDAYVACTPGDSTYMAVITDNGRRYVILIASDCVGKEALIDIV